MLAMRVCSTALVQTFTTIKIVFDFFADSPISLGSRLFCWSFYEAMNHAMFFNHCIAIFIKSSRRTLAIADLPFREMIMGAVS